MIVRLLIFYFMSVGLHHFSADTHAAAAPSFDEFQPRV